MRIETFKHVNVLSDGTFIHKDGAVEVKGKIAMSQENGGCDIPSCNCSDGYWVSIVAPRTISGTVEGIKVLFDSKEEFDLFMKTRELKMK